MENPRRIVVVAKAVSPTAGGVETYTAEVAKAYTELGFRVTLIAPTPSVSDTATTTSVESVVPVPLGGQAAVGTATLLALAKRRRDLKRGAMLHATTWRMAIPIVALGLGAHTVVTIHGREVMNSGRAMSAVMNYVLSRIAGLIYVSRATKNASSGYLSPAALQGPAVISWNGPDMAPDVPTPRQRTSASDGVRILTVARLVPRKGIEEAVEAVSAIIRRYPDIAIRYDICGKGPRLDALRARVSQLGLEQVIRVHGYTSRENVRHLYANSDIFLHPHAEEGDGTDYEGFGITIADAMSYGLAVIVGANGGPLDYVVHGENGLLVSGRNSADIASALARLLSDDASRHNMQLRAQQTATQFSWKFHATAAMELLQSPQSVTN